MSQFNPVILASQTITATTVGTVQSPTPVKWGQIIVNVTARTSGSITPHIQGYDPASGSWYDILVGAAISSVSQTILYVGPAFTVTSNVSANAFLPTYWRVQLVTASSTNLVASVGAQLAP